MAAIRALEARSLEFMQEKEEKKRLEQRIAMLMGQMIRGERGGIPTAENPGGVIPGPELQVMMKEQQDKLRQEYDGVAKECLDLYNKLLVDGVAPEQARSILPQGTYTEFVWTGSLYAFARVYNLRIDAHAQWEIQEYAKAIDKLIAPFFPVSWQTLTTK
jgi:flavin-dependent thymidylate synthase